MKIILRNYYDEQCLVVTNSKAKAAQKIKLSIKDFSCKCLVIFTGEILNGKLHFCVVERQF